MGGSEGLDDVLAFGTGANHEILAGGGGGFRVVKGSM